MADPKLYAQYKKDLDLLAEWTATANTTFTDVAREMGDIQDRLQELADTLKDFGNNVPEGLTDKRAENPIYREMEELEYQSKGTDLTDEEGEYFYDQAGDVDRALRDMGEAALDSVEEINLAIRSLGHVLSNLDGRT